MNENDAPQTNGPPVLLKVYAPNGKTIELEGWVGFGCPPGMPPASRLFVLYTNNKAKVLNPLVVIVNTENGMVVYDPRSLTILRQREVSWLQKHPHWPAILELHDNPAGDDNEGIEG